MRLLLGNLRRLAACSLAVAAGAYLLQAAEGVRGALLAGRPVPWNTVLAPSWPEDATSLLAIVAAVGALELVLLGIRRSTLGQAFSSRSASHFTDLFYFVASLTGLEKWLTLAFTLGASVAIEELTSTGIGFAWCAALPLWMSVPMVFIVGDFADYWVHRFSHLPVMWPLHAVHHSADELTGLTAARHHFLSGFIGSVPYVVPAWALGFSPEAIALATLIGAVHVYYAHTDLPFPLWLERHLVMGVRLHRVHHARAPELRDKNFSGLVWWDKLFGTYKLVEDHRAVAVGVDDPRFDTGRPLRDCWTAMAIWLVGLYTAAFPASVKPTKRNGAVA